MFDFVRKHTKVMQFLLFLLIFPSFVLVGINGYNRFREKGDAVAKVDGHEIMQGDLDNAYKQEIDQLRAQMPNIDPKMLDTPAQRYATLERMVRDKVLSSAAAKSKLTTSDQRLAQELQQNELIRALRGPDGKLDIARYRQLLGTRGMSPEGFEAGVREDLSSRQVLAGVGGTSFATPADAKAGIDAFLEKREVQVARFDAADFAGKVNPTDADLEAFYKANPAMFQAPEQADVEYVMLDAESIMKSLPVNEQDLKTYYEQNVSRIGGQEERRASHILIAAAKDAPAAERAKAKAKAEEVLAQARKSPESFAELAKKYSQDPSSAAKGGDLDYFTRGAMTKPFEDAAFALKPGEIGGPVETEFGFHIIKLTDVKAPKQKTFEEMRPELEAELKKQQAQKKFAELADTFSNSVYEQADSLKPVADRLKLEIKTASNVQRTPVPGNKGPFGNPKFIAALFAPDSLEKKRNTEAVEIAPNTMVSGRVVKYTPARTLPLAEVKDRVRQRVVAARAAELARSEGKQKLAAWKAAPASATLPGEVVVSRQDGQRQPPSVVEAALRADPGALPAFVGVDLGEQGYAVVKVNKVIPRDPPAPAVAQQELEQYTKWWSAAENLAYYKLLKERFKAKIELPKPAAPELPAQ